MKTAKQRQSPLPAFGERNEAKLAGATELSRTRRSKALICIAVISLCFLILTGCGPSLDEFAKCTKASGMSVYGTQWCPHCANVKKSFGSSFKYVDYVECDPNGPDAQAARCKRDGIEGYPSFRFGDGLKVAGELNLELIADKTGCELPE